MMGTNKGGFQLQNWDSKGGYKTVQWKSNIAAPTCACCHKTVFPAEEINAAGQKFHKFCLKCTACNNLLNSGNLNEHDKKIYCVPCHRRQFGPRGLGRGPGTSSSMSTETPPSSPSLNRVETTIDGHRHHRKTSTGSSPSRTSSDDDSRHVQPLPTNVSSFRNVSTPATICPRCSKTVYCAEEVKAVGKSFHKRCYTCAQCKGSINAGRYSEHDGELYDNNCYRRLFGPKGVGFGIVASAVSTEH